MNQKVIDLVLFGIMSAVKAHDAFTRIGDWLLDLEAKLMYGDEVSTRLMTTKDIDQLIEIENEAFHDPWVYADFKAHIKSNQHICTVAVQYNRIVGYLVYECRKSNLYIRSMAVAGNVRRKGIGTILMESMEEMANNTNRNSCRLHAPETNLGAQLFFKACGYRAVNVFRKFFNDDVDAFYFTKRMARTQVARDKAKA